MRRYRKKKAYHKPKPSLVSMIPIAYVGAVAAGRFAQSGASAMTVRTIIGDLTGFDIQGENAFNSGNAMRSVGIVVGTMVGKKIIAMSGVNRAMKGLPIRL